MAHVALRTALVDPAARYLSPWIVVSSRNEDDIAHQFTERTTVYIVQLLKYCTDLYLYLLSTCQQFSDMETLKSLHSRVTI